jgi:peptidoglycan/LPS O-acetylase OafA/YrhL
MESVVLTKGIAGWNRSARPKNRTLPCLTRARFAAALLVVLFHFGWLHIVPGLFFDYGRQAVSFFFILSGVVLAYTYRDAINSRTIGWWDFFNLRLSRIVPVHVATWLIATVLFMWFAWRPDQGKHPVAWIMGLFCLQVYWPSADNLFRWNGQAWSISCELFFYALFPLLLLPLTRRLKSISSVIAAMAGIYLLEVVLYLCASGILVKLITPGHSFLGYQTYDETTTSALLVFLPLRLGEFVIGMCLGLLLLRPEPLLKSPLRANLLLGLSAVAHIVLMHLSHLVNNPLAVGIQTYVLFIPALALTLVAVVSGLTVITPLLENRIALLLGEASYSLYLVHGFFMPGKHPSNLRYISCVVGSIVSSIVLYWFLERPARRIWRQVLGSRRTSNAKPIAHSGAVENDLGSGNPAGLPTCVNQS